MAKILVGDKDALFAAALADHLHVAGHEIVVEPNVGRIVPVAAQEEADLVVLALLLPSTAGVHAVRAMRGLPSVRSLPILVLAQGQGADGRVALLKAGADDLVNKSCGLEEILLRIERLLGGRASGLSLRGDFRDQPPWELIQCIQQVGKSGELIVRSRSGSGKLRVEGGQIPGASWGKREDQEALLAILGLKEGRFQFVASPTEEQGDGAEARPASEGIGGNGALPVQKLLMESAWLEDELEKRSRHLPGTGAPLAVAKTSVPALGPEFDGIPTREVYDRLAEEPGLRLFDLQTEGEKAPLKVRLAVALLAEAGAIRHAEPSVEARGSFPTTHELSSSVILDVTVTDLHRNLLGAGFSGAIPLLLLAEEGIWGKLQQLFRGVPGASCAAALQELAERLETRRSGNVLLENELGQLSLHVRQLNPGGATQIEAVIPLCAGVVVWLDGAEDLSLLRRVADRLESTRGGSMGTLVAERPEARVRVEGLAEELGRWSMSEHTPQSLVGVLRMFHPRS